MPKLANKTTAGWSDEARRKEFARLFDLVLESGLTRAEAKQVLANRLTIGVGSIDGWLSQPSSDGKTKPRRPPDWKTLDILRYELGVLPVRRII